MIKEIREDKMNFDDIKEIVYLYLKNKDVEQQASLKKQNYKITNNTIINGKNSVEIKIIDSEKNSDLYISIDKRDNVFFLTFRKKENNNHEICLTIPTSTPKTQDDDFNIDFVHKGTDLKMLTPKEFRQYILEENKYKDEFELKKLIEDAPMPDISKILQEHNDLFLEISNFMEEYKDKKFDINLFNKKTNSNMRIKI